MYSLIFLELHTVQTIVNDDDLLGLQAIRYFGISFV